MCDQVGSKVYSTMGTFSQHISQLISLTQDAWYLPLDVNELTINICFVAGIGRASSLGCGSRRHSMSMLSTAYAHLVRCGRALSLPHQVVVVRRGRMVDLHLLLHVLNTRVNGVVLLLSVGRSSRPNILHWSTTCTLKVTALFIEMLKHLDD